jgi:hypothetical protein
MPTLVNSSNNNNQKYHKFLMILKIWTTPFWNISKILSILHMCFPNRSLPFLTPHVIRQSTLVYKLEI